jgi:hypothetical protein
VAVRLATGSWNLNFRSDDAGAAPTYGRDQRLQMVPSAEQEGSRRVTKARITLMLVAVSACLAGAQSGEAATLGLQGGPGLEQLVYEAEEGERNLFTVRQVEFDFSRCCPAMYTPVAEVSAPLTLGIGCTGVTEVICDVPRREGVDAGVRALLGNRDDRADVQPYYADSYVWGGEGDDRITSNGWAHGDAWGGAGSDSIAVAAQYTSVAHGGSGDDTLWAGAGVYAFELYGGDGNDMLTGNGTYKTFDGGRGADTIVAPGGQYTRTVSRGGQGPDVITGGGEVFGEAGDDRIDVSGRDTPDNVSCGGGTDTVLANPEDTVDPDCESVTLTGATMARVSRAVRWAAKGYRTGAALLRPHTP